MFLQLHAWNRRPEAIGAFAGTERGRGESPVSHPDILSVSDYCLTHKKIDRDRRIALTKCQAARSLRIARPDAQVTCFLYVGRGGTDFA